MEARLSDHIVPISSCDKFVNRLRTSTVSPALCFPTNSPPCLLASIHLNVWRKASPPAPPLALSSVSPKSFGKTAQPLSWTASHRNGLKSSKLQKAKPPSPAPWHFTFTGRQMAASPAWCAGRSGFGEKWALPAFSSPMPRRPRRIGTPSRRIQCSASVAPILGGILAPGGMQRPLPCNALAPRRNYC